MKNVENMITEKDLLYLEDLFKWHQNGVNKLKLYLNELDENDSIKLLNTILDMHETFIDDIKGFLKG